MRRISKSGLVRDERGQGLLEFALILPVLMLVMVGLLEFGAIYSKVISMRQGVREAGRQGSVANFGTKCTAGAPGAAENRRQLICLVKDQAGVGDNVAVHITFDPPGVNGATTNSSYLAGNGLVICAIQRLADSSLTGLIPLGDRTAKTKAQFRIEKVPDPPAEGLLSGGDVVDSTGAAIDWSWCT